MTPATRLVRVEMEILEAGSDARGGYAVAEATLWGDDTCIYRVSGPGGPGVRVVPGEGPATPGGADARGRGGRLPARRRPGA
ncbi:hypothetical protein ACFV3R_30860 [Streptomyces sp. NPDC059740]|uniref:hypothetical protein n=1 Tax=Streptomyces sp. NPDC059740 TaxID=3346926 RepID=UPI0036578138